MPYEYHNQRIAMIFNDGLCIIDEIGCLMVQHDAHAQVQYPRCVKNAHGTKFMLSRYNPETDTVYYIETKSDPWSTPGHKHFKEANEKSSTISTE